MCYEDVLSGYFKSSIDKTIFESYEMSVVYFEAYDTLVEKVNGTDNRMVKTEQKAIKFLLADANARQKIILCVCLKVFPLLLSARQSAN